jgi:HEAT repeat protein
MRREGDTLPLWQKVMELLKTFLAYDIKARQEARQELSKLDREQVIDVLSTVLADQDPQEPELRYRSAEMLVKIDPKRAAKLLIPYLESADSLLRSHVCGLLSICGGKEAIIPLVNILRNDPKVSARMNAAFTLGKIGDQRAIPALRWAQQHDEGTDWEGRCVSDAATGAIEEILARYSSTDDSTAM